MKFVLNKDELTITDKEVNNSGSIQYYEADIEYDESWQGLTIEARMRKSGAFEGVALIPINNKIYIDTDVQGKYEIGFVGYTIENKKKVYQISSTTKEIAFVKGAGEMTVSNKSDLPKASQWEIYLEQAEAFIADGNEILENAEDKIDEMNEALEDVNTAITDANNLDLDVNKGNKTATVSLTKKDGTTKTVQIADGLSLEFMWQGTSLGIRVEGQENYTFVDLQGIQGPVGPQGEAFTVKKTYSTIQAMVADYDNMQIDDYAMIDGDVEKQENATLWQKREEEDPTYRWHYLADFSGASGIKGETGLTPNIQIGTVTSGNAPSVTRSGTDENPVLNFVLEKGEKGDTGDTGATGETGKGISSITKTGTQELVDTYTITYTDGTTTTFTVTNGEDGEVTQEQLDEVIERQDKLATMMKDLTETGTSIDTTKSADWYGDLDFEGFSRQNTRSGKNYFNANAISNSNIVVSNNGKTITMPEVSSGNGVTSGVSTLAQLCPSLQVGDTVYLYATTTSTYNNFIYLITSTFQWHFGNARTITQNDLDSIVYFYGNRYSDGETGQVVITDMRIVTTQNDTWEQYGVSPSPEYPSKIRNLEARNLFDDSNPNNKWVKNDGTINTTTANNANILKYSCSEGDEFTLQATFESTNANAAIVIAFYDSNDNLLLRDTANASSIKTIQLSKIAPANTSYMYAGHYVIIPETIQLEKGSATEYVPYNSIAIKDVNRNIWDEETTLGFYNENGIWVTRNDILSAKNPIYVDSSKTYYVKVPSLFYYTQWKKDGTFISRAGVNTGGGAITLDNNTAYIHFNLPTSYGTTYNNDICINVSDNQNGTYTTHEEEIIDFPLQEGQKLYEDSYLADDGIHNVRGQVVLDGSNDEGWKYENSSTDPTNRTVIRRSRSIANTLLYLSTHFILSDTSTSNRLITSGTGLYLSLDDTIPGINVNDDDATKLSKMLAWLSNNPVTLEYELAEEEIIPYTEAQQEAYNKLKKLPLYRYVNHITLLANEETNMTLKYKQDLQSQIAEMTQAIVALGGVV